MSNSSVLCKYFNKETKQWQLMVGSKFGRLTVSKFMGIVPHGTKGSASRYECICDCGNVVTRKHACLTQKQTISCGCWKAEKVSLRMRKDDTGFKDLWASYRKGAKARGLEWSLTEEQFKTLTSSPCHYTGRPPLQESRSTNTNKKAKKGLPPLPGGVYLFNGIDRLDNNKGYTWENCVACCEEANFMKRHLGHDLFISVCKEIAEHHKI